MRSRRLDSGGGEDGPLWAVRIKPVAPRIPSTAVREGRTSLQQPGGGVRLQPTKTNIQEKCKEVLQKIELVASLVREYIHSALLGSEKETCSSKGYPHTASPATTSESGHRRLLSAACLVFRCGGVHFNFRSHRLPLANGPGSKNPPRIMPCTPAGRYV